MTSTTASEAKEKIAKKSTKKVSASTSKVGKTKTKTETSKAKTPKVKAARKAKVLKVDETPVLETTETQSAVVPMAETITINVQPEININAEISINKEVKKTVAGKHVIVAWSSMCGDSHWAPTAHGEFDSKAEATQHGNKNISAATHWRVVEQMADSEKFDEMLRKLPRPKGGER